MEENHSEDLAWIVKEIPVKEHEMVAVVVIDNDDVSWIVSGIQKKQHEGMIGVSNMEIEYVPTPLTVGLFQAETNGMTSNQCRFHGFGSVAEAAAAAAREQCYRIGNPVPP